MLSQPKNRVQAIKSKFESLQSENESLVVKKNLSHLSKYTQKHNGNISVLDSNNKENKDEEKRLTVNSDLRDLNEDWSLKPNSSYLYSQHDTKVCNDTKITLSRQSSDPGKKLHRSHAFRCDRNQIVTQPKRYGSCNGRSETSDFSLKRHDKTLTKDRLKQLGNFIEDQMRKEGYMASNSATAGHVDSVPDCEVPKHILDQYAKVDKSNKAEKQDSLTDSGVSSETENIDDEKNKIRKLVTQYEKNDDKEKLIFEKDKSRDNKGLKNKDYFNNNENKHVSQIFENSDKQNAPIEILNNTQHNFQYKVEIKTAFDSETKISNHNQLENINSNSNLASMDDLCGSSETMRLERKNPHLVLTDTLKKALKQPLPTGPPPKKPPRIFHEEKPKKDTKKMLEKLEQVLQKREANQSKIYDIAEESEKIEKPKKEMHYLCTEILNIPNQTTDPFIKCLNSLNCAIMTNNSTLSLPYTRLNKCMCDKRLSTFKNDFEGKKCPKCQSNDDKDGFKCHLNCKCKVLNSEFYVPREHIYDVPFVEKSEYGSLNKGSRSMEDLRLIEDPKIYDEPCDISRPATPEVKSEFQKLKENFESQLTEKPKIAKKPLKVWKSTENVSEEFKFSKKVCSENKFATETKRYRRFDKEKVGFSLPKTDKQLDVDRENLNRLMSEIYETVTAACNMDEHKPGSFPTELSDNTSEESVKLTRSLTEKRKNYVRRVSSRVAYIDQNVKTRFRHQTSVCSYKSDLDTYSTFRSWKSFRTSQNNLAKMTVDTDVPDAGDNLSIDEKTGCVDLALPFEARERGLFNVCLLVGLNYMTGQAYVKSVFPSQVQVPPHIENLIFPETLSGSLGEWSAERDAQCYSLVLTDEKGERAYGYCRRVLPEGATTCLPLGYCLIGKYRAPGFYYKILQEIESHHGNPEIELNQVLQQLFETDFPHPGEQITITYNRTEKGTVKNTQNIFKNRTLPRKGEVSINISVKTESVSDDTSAAEFIEKEKEKEIVVDKESLEKHELPEFYDLENNNSPKRVMICLESPRTRTIKRPIEPRADEDNMSLLVDQLGPGLLIKVFGTLLLERKVIIVSDHLGIVSSCMEALQSALYPFVWQQPLISTIPAEIHRDVLEAPLPILAGMMKTHDFDTNVLFEEGMLIDLTNPNKVVFYQGDESTILPTHCYKTLKTSLNMETNKQKERQDTKTRNVMISEAFLRFFVDILGEFSKFFTERELKEDELGKDGVVFDKEAFIKQASSKQNQFFLEWFTETAMFTHFIQNMAVFHKKPTGNDSLLVDTPLPNFYELFNERVKSRNRASTKISEKNYKSAVNKKVKLLKTKLRDLVA
ncbi:uncharacterized protein LOC123717246 isoform X1 [Pieris brassicae]|uniref:uncharacterized protein LOC123717246 isoform X1 n=2 Tax=Pieris brassicae TaxID=7116 RepID=UPI001E661416|nr:uncharacterized protein LOC123717246 isoform X1 [Pieris brassicae]